MQHIQETVGCRSTLETTELLGVDVVLDVVNQPLNREISSTLDSTGVRAMGLKSPLPVIGLTFGTGAMLESFHCVGNTPDETNRLKINATGSASSGANSLRRLAGIPSGPGAL